MAMVVEVVCVLVYHVFKCIKCIFAVHALDACEGQAVVGHMSSQVGRSWKG